MSGEIESIGDAMTGAVVARELEPETGSASSRADVCLNCGTALAGDYCHRCGQSGHVHRTLGAFGHDIAHGVLHFEGKIWRTLPKLFVHPGELTRRYVAGERARFVSPIALFLFSVFLMFAVMSAFAGMLSRGLDKDEYSNNIAAERTAIKGKIEKLELRRAEAFAARTPTAAIDEEIADDTKALEILKGMAGEDNDIDAIVKFDGPEPENWIGDAYRKAKENPSLLIYKLQTSAYKFSWALIPISVPFMWLLFPFSRRSHLYDHTVFVTYSMAFMTLLIVLVTLVAAGTGAGTGLYAFALTIIGPVHMYRQLRGAYGLTRLSALVRTALLAVFAVVAALLFFLLLLTLGVLG